MKNSRSITCCPGSSLSQPLHCTCESTLRSPARSLVRSLRFFLRSLPPLKAARPHAPSSSGLSARVRSFQRPARSFGRGPSLSFPREKGCVLAQTPAVGKALSLWLTKARAFLEELPFGLCLVERQKERACRVACQPFVFRLMVNQSEATPQFDIDQISTKPQAWFGR